MAKPQSRKTDSVAVMADKSKTVDMWSRSTRKPISTSPTAEKMLNRDALAIATTSESSMYLAKPKSEISEPDLRVLPHHEITYLSGILEE